MKKQNILVIVFLGLILLIGVYYLGRISNTDQKNTTDQSSQNEIFADKIKCGDYIEKLRDNAIASQYELDLIYKVFYSQSLNTCLSEQYNLYYGAGSVPQGEILEINNVLTDENVWTSEKYTTQLKGWDAETILDQQAVNYI